ncbi:Alpha/beta hydrolase [Giardia duodenalis]|uniref:Alpha/beta hydrolase n=1 Tax=Giardia intestinalis TaxID=5741 RepID=V6TKG3_GIAIN|nr:Alpha/beta hydrolase [Giardia intestinalis]
MSPRRAISPGRSYPRGKKALDAAIYTTSRAMAPPEQAMRQKTAERMDGTSTCASLEPSALHIRKSTAERPPVLLTLDQSPLCQPPLEASQFSHYPPANVAAEEVWISKQQQEIPKSVRWLTIVVPYTHLLRAWAFHSAEHR